jgi:hypothetical protein
MERELPKIVSVDDHVIEPAPVWQTWLPEKHRALGPRIERPYRAGERPVGGGAFAESWADERTPRPGCYEPRRNAIRMLHLDLEP